MHLLVDCDTPVYAASVVHENDGLEQACFEVDKIISNLLETTQATSYSIYLTGDNNFRYGIYPEYKQNRLGKPVPRHRKDVQDYVARNWNAIVSDGCEADDLLGIAQCSQPFGSTCIASIDKDLNQIPGNHYHPGIKRNQEYIREPYFYTVTPEEGLRFFYYQLLVGDSTDNIKGAPGIGPKKAENILTNCKTRREFYEAVEPFFSCEEELLQNARCIYIWQQENDCWQIPPKEDK